MIRFTSLASFKISLLLFSLAVLPLVGCGIGSTGAPDITPAASAPIVGTVFGGQQPITHALVGVWAAGTVGYGSGGTLLSTTYTDGNGNFGFAANAYTCPQANTPMYITGIGGNPGLAGNPNVTSIDLGVALGPCAMARSEYVHVDEVTTIALAYALAQFFTPKLGPASADVFGGPSSGSSPNIAYSPGFVSANSYTAPTLATLRTGLVNVSDPNVTVEAAKIYSIANSLAACVNSTGSPDGSETNTVCGKLFSYTMPPGGTTRPSDTLQAAVQMALFPYQNVTAIYNLAGSTPPYPGLVSAPHDLTIGVKYTSTSFGLTVNNVATTSNLAIDALGKIWLPTTSPAGVVGFDPTTNTFSGPYNNITANLASPQTVFIDREGYVWVPDSTTGQAAAFLSTNPSTQLSYGAAAGFVYGLSIGNDDSVAFAAKLPPPLGRGNNSIYVVPPPIVPNPRGNPYLLGGVPADQPSFLLRTTSTSTYAYYIASHAGTTGYLEYTTDGNTFLNDVLHTYPGGGSGQLAQLNNGNNDVMISLPLSNRICSYFVPCQAAGFNGLNVPQGIAVDGLGFAWVANSGNGSVSQFNLKNIVGNVYTGPDTGFALHGAGNGNTMTNPFGIAIDNSGNVWVSNQTAAGGPYVLSEIIGVAGPTITPLYTQINNHTIGTQP